jgi:pheromone shutdown-related protein TraB
MEQELQKKGSLRIIGTAHVSEKSIEEVKAAILEIEPDLVAVELDLARYNNLLNEKMGENQQKDVKVRELIKNDQLTIFVVSKFLSYMQKRIGEDVGVKPGSEMMVAIEAAEEVRARVVLIDRDIQVTLKRALNQMSLWEKLKFASGLLGSIFSRGEVVDDIEKIKESDTLSEVMEYFQKMSPKAFDVLVTERDAYMARMLLDIPSEENVVAVVGAGHQKGIKDFMNNPETIPLLSELLKIKN